MLKIISTKDEPIVHYLVRYSSTAPLDYVILALSSDRAEIEEAYNNAED